MNGPDVTGTALTRLAGVASLAAAVLHGALADEHLREWWGYGAFFVAASIAQGVLGLVLLAMPSAPSSWAAEQWRSFRLRLYGVGIAGNLAVLALYAVTRTVGIPVFGPEAGEVEAIGPLDLPTKAAELLVVACLGILRWRTVREGSRARMPLAS